jgi:RimJ/RimL family protein N-acetyltransferase
MRHNRAIEEAQALKIRKLATPRLVLEPLVAAHAPEMFAVLSDAAIFRFMDEAPPASLEALADRYGRLETRLSGDGRERWLNWVVREKASAKAVGFVQATLREDGTTLIAYVITPAFQKRGFAREATRAMIAELGSKYGAKRPRASVDPRNTASLALLASLGFREVPKGGGGDRIFVLEGPPA